MLVAASAMSAAPGPGVGGGVGCEEDEGSGCGPRPGTIAVLGSRLPPDISAVGASAETGGGVRPSSAESGGANTVAGSGTDASSPPAELVSVQPVPRDGVAGTPSDAVGS